MHTEHEIMPFCLVSSSPIVVNCPKSNVGGIDRLIRGSVYPVGEADLVGFIGTYDVEGADPAVIAGKRSQAIQQTGASLKIDKTYSSEFVFCLPCVTAISGQLQI